MDELESDFLAGIGWSTTAGPGFSKIEPYKHVITRCRKQVEAKKRIRPWRVHGDAMFAPLHVNPCVYERSREHVSRDKTNLKLFLFLPLSLYLSISLSGMVFEIGRSVREYAPPQSPRLAPSYLTLP